MSSFGNAKENPQASIDSGEQASQAAEDANPYSAIIKANVFHLTEAPKPAERPNQELANVPKVNISGFVRHADQPVRALFATVPKDPKELPRYFNLAEGEKEDILQVTKIHPSQDAVDVVIAGTPVTLTTKSNSFVQPLPPPPKGGIIPNPSSPAAVAYQPPIAQPVAVSTPYPSSVVVAGGGVSASGGNSVTTIGGNSGGAIVSGGGSDLASSTMGGASSGASPGSGLQSVPTRGLPAPAFPAEYHPRTAQESAIIMAVDSQLHEGEIQSGHYPPPPPIPH